MSNLKKFVAGFSTLALAVSMLVVPVTSANAATAGEVYKDTNGTVFFITKDMQKRPFTSAGAFMSYGFLSFSQVKDADAAVNALATGSFIAPQDGRIFCATETKASDVSGECSLITGGKKAAFTSASVFTGQGYSFSRAYYGDSSFLEKTSNVDNASAQHRPGTLINNNGTIQLVVTGGLWGTPSMDVFNSWGWSIADVVPANSADLLLSQKGVISARQAGELSPTATTTPVNPGDCNLDGNAGDITTTSSGLYGSEEVGEGEEDQGVMAFEVEASDDSDVAVKSVKIAIQQTAGSVSQKLGDYADEVKVWYGDEEVGSADSSTFTKTGTIYTKTITLDCSEVSAGETGEFSVSVTAVNNLDSADIASDDFEIELYQIRFEDGDGVVSTVDVGDKDISTPAATGDVHEDFNFVDFATANDVEFTVSLTDDMDDVNKAHNIVVSEDNSTNNESVLAFSIKASGDSDIWVDEIPVFFTTNDTDVDGAGSDTAALSTVVSKADLYLGNTLVDSKTISGAGLTQTVLFDDIDTTIDAGDTEDFTVKVKVLPLTNHYAEGTTLKAELRGSASDEVDDIVAEDQEGDSISDTNALGSALGEASSLFSDGISVTVNGTPTTTVTANDGTAPNDSVEFAWDVTITNIGDDAVYINRENANVKASSGAGVDTLYATEGVALAATPSGIISGPVAREFTGNSAVKYFKLDVGQSADFTITVAGINATVGQTRASLTGIEWTVSDVSAAGPYTINSYTAHLSEDTRTPYRFAN